MANGNTQQYIKVSKENYLRLVDLDKQFGQFLRYIEEVQDVKEARKDIKSKRTRSLEDIERELNINK